MPSSLLPTDIIFEISQWCSQAVQCRLMRLSKEVNLLISPRLYRRISFSSDENLRTFYQQLSSHFWSHGEYFSENGLKLLAMIEHIEVQVKFDTGNVEDLWFWYQGAGQLEVFTKMFPILKKVVITGQGDFTSIEHLNPLLLTAEVVILRGSNHSVRGKGQPGPATSFKWDWTSTYYPLITTKDHRFNLKTIVLRAGVRSLHIQRNNPLSWPLVLRSRLSIHNYIKSDLTQRAVNTHVADAVHMIAQNVLDIYVFVLAEDEKEGDARERIDELVAGKMLEQGDLDIVTSVIPKDEWGTGAYTRVSCLDFSWP